MYSMLLQLLFVSGVPLRVFPPFHITGDEVSAPLGCLNKRSISGYQLVRSRTPCLADLVSSFRVRGAIGHVDRFRRHILM